MSPLTVHLQLLPLTPTALLPPQTSGMTYLYENRVSKKAESFPGPAAHDETVQDPEAQGTF